MKVVRLNGPGVIDALDEPRFELASAESLVRVGAHRAVRFRPSLVWRGRYRRRAA